MAANPPARRIITGHTPEGKATIISDKLLSPVSPAAPTDLSHDASKGGFINLWRTDGFPANVNGEPKESHGAAVPISDSTDTIIRIVDLAPGVSVPMHRTISNDVVHVTKGELTLELDDGVETVLKAGDTCVQRGTVHAWHNRTSEMVRGFFVMMPGTEAVVEGKKLAPVDI
ncbi:cupin domain-containing protein [Xylogone sp. PMI_703]|nr:cupin domain-containing protein [Xylogone sp. PMI_703]